MLWHEHLTWFGVARRLGWVLEEEHIGKNETQVLELLFEKKAEEIKREGRRVDVGSPEANLQADLQWCYERKPFFNVWPVIAPSLVRISLDIPGELLTKPIGNLPCAMLIRFPVGREFEGIHSFLASRAIIGRRGDKERKGIQIRCDAGERANNHKDCVVTWDACFCIEDEATVEEALADCAARPDSELTADEHNIVVKCARFFVAIALMRDDPSLIEPVVLSKDRLKYIGTGSNKLVEKARKRGVVGWNVGANVEVSPHYRRAHFALRWTGKGRKIPRIVPIKGTVVKRVRMTDVPTGYLEKSGYN